MTTSCYSVFAQCVKAIQTGKFIASASDKDKEFHFQDWVGERLDELQLSYDEPKRNTYPDFRLVHSPEGYEVKGLESPGRIASYDSNSQVPTGMHRKRTIYYVFGTYPKDKTPYPRESDGMRRYPVGDFIICHGDFLNADHTYVHKNKSVKGFGTYGDILIRDRKMYVPKTPFALTAGTGGLRTLIVPAALETADPQFMEVGRLTRVEAALIVTGYSFNLVTNQIQATTIPNPNAGDVHEFIAYRLVGEPANPVSMNYAPIPPEELEEIEECDK